MLKPISFKPAWWLPGPHLQTLWAARANFKTDYKLRRERLELPDGDFIDLDWLDKAAAPRVLLIHGLNGGAESSYLKRMLQAIHVQGWCGIILHLRGCSGEPNRLARSYHAGETDDLKFVMEVLQRHDPHTPIVAVGYSLGGNMLLKCLGETQTDNPLTAAVAVSVPFELSKAAKSLDTGFAKVYQWSLLNNLRRFISNKFAVVSMPFDFGDVNRLRNFYQFDNEITAPLHGFTSADDYYQQSSSRRYLQFIQKPTLIVHAKNDPFMTPDVIPAANELSPHVKLELTASGGHVGFISGNIPGKPQYWLEQRIIGYLKQYF